MEVNSPSADPGPCNHGFLQAKGKILETPEGYIHLRTRKVGVGVGSSVK